MSDTLNLSIARGTTFGPVYIYLKDENGAAVAPTGYQAFAQVRKLPSTDVILDLAPVVEATRIKIPELTDEQTNDLSNVVASWDCIIEDSMGRRLPPIVAGSFTIWTPTTQL